MKKYLYVMFISIMFVTSCTTYHFVPILNETIAIQNERGKSYPVYIDDKYGMIIMPEYKESELMLKITIKNTSTEKLSFSDSDFAVFASEDRIAWKQLKVYSSSEFYKKEKAEYTTGAVIMVLSAAASSYNAGRGYSTTRGNVYGNTAYGSYSGSYTSTTSYYDPTAAELASQRNAQMVSDYAQSGKEWLEVLENNLFYSTDIEPGKEYFGLVFSEKGSGRYYKIECSNPLLKIVSIEYERVAD